MKTFKESLSEQFKDPKSFLQLIATILLGVSALVVLVWWIAGYQRPLLQIPLIIVGVTAIVLLVTMVEKGFALGLSLLVIGTIVTTEDFLIKISHLLREGGKIEEYILQPMTPSPSPDEIASGVTKTIVEELPQLQKDKARIESILKDSEIKKLASKVGGSRLFHEIAFRPKDWSSFVARFEKTGQFEREIVTLSHDGVITCQEGRFEDCRLTDVGKEVKALVGTPMPPLPLSYKR